MSTAIRERFLASWDKDLSDIWKYIAPVLPDIRHRSGNDAAATLCTFSKNWRTNRKQIRTIYDTGVEHIEQDEQEQEETHNKESDENTKDSGDDTSSTSEMGGKKKSTKDSQNQKTTRREYRATSPERYTVISPYHRPMSPIRMRAPHNATPHAHAQPTGKRARPKSSKTRCRSTVAHGQSETHDHGQRETNGHGQSETNGHGQRETSGHGQRETNGHGQSETNGHGQRETSGHGQSETNGLGQSETNGHEEQRERIEKEHQQLKEAIKTHRDREEELESQLQEMHTAHEQMEQDIKNLDADKTRLVDRVAELTEIKVAQDERELQLKGVTARNSPLKVAQEYEMLYTNEWLDAKQALDEYSDWKVHDKDKFEILTSTLTECYQMATDAYDNHRVVLVKLLNDPFAAARHPLKLKKRTSADTSVNDVDNGNQDEVQNQMHPHKLDLSPALEEAVLRYMKIQCDAMDFRHTSRYVIASVFATLHPLLIDHDITKSARIKHFVRASLQLCWKMVIQDPPLTFDLSQIGEPYDEEKLELHTSSEPANTPNAVVDHYVYPAMLKADKEMHKALVILAVPEDQEEP